jgi:pilus assembly protein Flp/PilA
MKNLIARFLREEEGQDIIEYALLAGFISVSGYLILSSIGSDVNTLYTKVQTATNNAAGTGGS